jgi:hypothetical protein
MKATASLFSLLLAAQLLPWAIQPVHAQAADSGALQRDDEFDARRMRNDYERTFMYAGRQNKGYVYEEVTETTKTLADGNQLKNKQSVTRYRDQKGRTRVDFKSPRGNERIFIGDPVTKVAYLIRPDRKDILRIKGEPPARRAISSLPVPTLAVAWSKQVTTSLGVKDVAGVQAAGTVTETYYPAGARGNEKEMVETSETWHSGDLAGVVYNRMVSPSTGEIVTHLENVKLGDVPDALFGVPSDYPIRDIRFDSAASIE